jgi:hypothetical protein
LAAFHRRKHDPWIRGTHRKDFGMRHYLGLFTIIGCAAFLLFEARAFVEAQQGSSTSSPPTSSIPYLVSDLGGVSMITAGSAGAIDQGYAVIQPDSGTTTPSGLAIFGFRQNGILVSEAGVPATLPVLTGRIYAEVNGPVNTGVAIANPNGQTATITFYFTDQNGTNLGSGSTTVVGGGQISAFLNQPPFNGGSSFSGTFTFTSDVPVGVVALRGFTNERSEFLLTTLPVSAVATTDSGTSYMPEFADGGGWVTQIELVNPTDGTINGTVQFFGQGSATTPAQPATVTIAGQSGNTFNYTIPPRSSRRFQTAGSGSSTVVGSARITPSMNNKAPSGLAIFSFNNAGVRVSEAGVPASQTGLAFRMYAEASDASAGSIQTDVAIANPANTTAAVTFTLSTLAGDSTGLTGSAAVPANGQISLSLNQIRGFEALQTPFQGVLRISTTSPSGVSVIGVRGRYNERSDFLVTTTPPVNEAAPPVLSPLVIPQLADGGGYTSQFIVFRGSLNQTAGNQWTFGSLQFFDQAGMPLNLTGTLMPPAPSPSAPVITGISPASPNVSSSFNQTPTVIGANFQAGLRLTVIPPRFGFIQQLTPRSVTPTSFQTPGLQIGLLGAYAFQVQNPNGEKSAPFKVTTQFQTSGFTWIPEGIRLTDVSAGVPGLPFADSAVFQLKDGRWRMLFQGGDGFMRSAISPDGLSWTLEPSLPFNVPTNLFKFLRLDTGQIRAYFACSCGNSGNADIHSAISNDDGATWVMESGIRVPASIIGSTRLTGLSVVPTPDGRWRGYFAQQGASNMPVYSATSADLLNWTLDPGVRVGLSAPLNGAPTHPKAIVNSDGSVTLFYGGYAGIYTSTSADGLAFTTQTLIDNLGFAADPDIVPVGNGLRMYYNFGDNSGGAIYSALSPTAASASPMQPASPAARRWAELMKQVFAIRLLECPRCSGRMRS